MDHADNDASSVSSEMYTSGVLPSIRPSVMTHSLTFFIPLSFSDLFTVFVIMPDHWLLMQRWWNVCFLLATGDFLVTIASKRI